MALHLGSHVSMGKGLIGAAKEAHSYGADTFMIYTGAPQNTRRKPIEELKIEKGQACQGKPLILETPWLDAKTNLYTEEILFLRKDEYNEE